jgi:hypothetical protein
VPDPEWGRVVAAMAQENAVQNLLESIPFEDLLRDYCPGCNDCFPAYLRWWVRVYIRRDTQRRNRTEQNLEKYWRAQVDHDHRAAGIDATLLEEPERTVFHETMAWLSQQLERKPWPPSPIEAVAITERLVPPVLGLFRRVVDILADDRISQAVRSIVDDHHRRVGKVRLALESIPLLGNARDYPRSRLADLAGLKLAAYRRSVDRFRIRLWNAGRMAQE